MSPKAEMCSMSTPYFWFFLIAIAIACFVALRVLAPSAAKAAGAESRIQKPPAEPFCGGSDTCMMPPPA